MTDGPVYTHITISTWKTLVAVFLAAAICVGLVFVLFESTPNKSGGANAYIFMGASFLLIGLSVLSSFGRSTYRLSRDGVHVTEKWLTPVSFLAARGDTLIPWNEIASVWHSISTVRTKQQVYKSANGHIRTAAGREFKFSARVDTPAYLEKFVPFYETLRVNLPELNLTPAPIEAA
ncbi:hypothetical protein sos41_26730 [Alphaproteobacteria bacterium SO-S41]|nr:hypothetical protein sos41_26730 [Alphaproteobacteria bacterium SO-S41]